MRRMPTIPALLLLLLSLACAGRQSVPTHAVVQRPAPACPIPSQQPVSEQELDPEVNADISTFGGQGLTQQELKALKNEPHMSVGLKGRELEAFNRYFRFFTARNEDGSPGKGRRAFEGWLTRAQLYLPAIKQAIRDRGLPEDLAYLPFAESGFNPWAVSRSGAMGVWQFMPFTGKKYGLDVGFWQDQRRDPHESTLAALEYLAFLHKTFGDWYLALAAYNAGEGRVGRCLAASKCDNYFDLAEQDGYLANETRDYVPKFLAILKVVYNLEALGFAPLRDDCAPQVARLELKPGTDLKALARGAGMSWSEFSALNPAFKRSLSPPTQTTRALVPVHLEAQARSHLSGAQETGGSAGRYVVAKGDTWARLAARHGLPEDVLRDFNPGAGARLKRGQTLTIPGLEPATPSDAVVAEAQPARKARPVAGATHEVRKGDTLYAIAQQYELEVDDLLAANDISPRSILDVGQKIVIPGLKGPAVARGATQAALPAPKGTARVHVVGKGETLASIARANGLKPDDLRAANNMPAKASSLRVGQELRIPGAQAEAPQTVAAKAPEKPTRTVVAEKSNRRVTHEVRKGDTLSSIARHYKVTTNLLVAWNNLSRNSVLRPGDTLTLLLE